MDRPSLVYLSKLNFFPLSFRSTQVVGETVGLVDGADDLEDGLLDMQLSQSTGHMALISGLVEQKSVTASVLY